MKIIRYPSKDTWAELLRRPALNNRSVDAIVQPVLDDVRKRGDEALREYTSKFDKVDLQDLRVSGEEFLEASKLVDDELKQAIGIAVRNIETFHKAQQIKAERIETAAGVSCWQKAVAIQKVGLYVPGGTAPLFSTVLMLAVPARIAGCSEIVLCSPPGKNGKIHPAVLYAAQVTGVTSVFKIGGAQAIAAMAYGTATVPKVYKIFGPGNQYVTAAKQLVSRGDVAIDMPAGPSEVAVIADETADPVFMAADLLSQAEHGVDSQVLLFTNNENTAENVLSEVERQVKLLSRQELALGALASSKIVVMKTLVEIMEMVNEYAPEHLIIAADNHELLAEKVINAGSVFLGHYTPESAGDYASGTNHTLPTNGYAKAYNGVNLDNFVRKITFQHITREGLRRIGPTVMRMAAEESLTAHKNAVAVRIK
ncbi:MAG: histidinol dehydrogenase [Bacteroidales bacterium]|nr:histidinol dehydrogenase [Bacteroidales bacterium]